MTKKALAEIQNPGKRDNAAEACARNLAQIGKSGAAAEVANTIQNVGRRDRVLSKIANGGD